MKKLALVSLVLAAALVSAGCESSSSARLVLMEGGKADLTATKWPWQKEDGFYKVIRETAEHCARELELERGKTHTVHFRMKELMPTWDEDKGWRFKDVECVPAGEAAAEAAGEFAMALAVAVR